MTPWTTDPAPGDADTTCCLCGLVFDPARNAEDGSARQLCTCPCCENPEQHDAVCAECCPCTGASTDLTPCGVGACPSITRVGAA